MVVDYLIVGSGLTGATIARTLVDQGKDVLVVDRRSHLGGNVHDFVHESGIRIHTYGPHYFRTSADSIWSYVTRLPSSTLSKRWLMSEIDGRLEYWPIQEEYITRTIGHEWRPSHRGESTNFEEASLAMMPSPIYAKFVQGYTAKQWGVDPRSLAAGLAGRFDVRRDGEIRLKSSKYQGIPRGGYARFMAKMLDGIRTISEVDYLRHREEFQGRVHAFFTGPIDEYFGFDLGRLTYRGQKRAHTFLPETAWHQPAPQVNHPSTDVPIIRTLGWKHMMEPELKETFAGTVLTTEAPYSPQDPSDYEYPFPDVANQLLFTQYQERADAIDGLTICGRLGEYRYYDMDQAIGRAMTLARRVLNGHNPATEPQ